MPAEPFGEPVADQFGLMARRIVHDDVDVEIGRDMLFDGVEEATEFLRPMARHAFADDGSGLHVEGGKERGRPVPLIVMGVPLGLPGSHRQQRLGAIQRLDLRFLIDAEHQRVVRRVEIEADDVAHLVNKQRVCRQLEGFAPVRLEGERPPDAMHGRDRQTRGLGHRARTPVGRGGRHRLQCRHHHFSDLLIPDLARSPRAGLVGKAVQPFGGEPLAPSRHRDAGHPKLLGDREIGRAIGRQKHDLGPHRVGTRYLPATCSRLKLTPLGLVQLDPNRRSPGHCRLLDRAPTRKKARNGFTG